MKEPIEQEIQQRLNQIPHIFETIAFDQVIEWVYQAPNPQEYRWKIWLRKLIGRG